MNQELVSVIMPTFNAGRYIADSIESILNQTYTNLELLITDDCSSDETRTILTEFSMWKRKTGIPVSIFWKKFPE